MRAKPGMVLIEVVAAIAILGSVAAAYLALASRSMALVRRAIDHEVVVARAGDFLGVVSLWSRDDLLHHLGERREGPWILAIQGDGHRLFRATVMDSVRVPLVSTVLFREVSK